MNSVGIGIVLSLSISSCRGELAAAPAAEAITPTPTTASIGTSATRRSVTPRSLVYRVGGDVTPPRLIHRVEPGVPEECKSGHRFDSNLSIFEAVIAESGDVRDLKTRIVPQVSPPCPEFEAAQRRAISTWKYAPARLKGKPVAVYLTVTVLVHFR